MENLKIYPDPESGESRGGKKWMVMGDIRHWFEEGDGLMGHGTGQPNYSYEDRIKEILDPNIARDVDFDSEYGTLFAYTSTEKQAEAVIDAVVLLVKRERAENG